MTTPIELQVWLKLALGLALLVGALFAAFVVGVWIYAAWDILRTIWRFRRR